jgi:hypothetical protein
MLEAWRTDPEHFVRWWGPKGYRQYFMTIDQRGFPSGELRSSL